MEPDSYIKPIDYNKLINFKLLINHLILKLSSDICLFDHQKK